MPRITVFDRFSMWMTIQWQHKWRLIILVILFGWLFVGFAFVLLIASLIDIGTIKGDPELWKKIEKIKKELGKDPNDRTKDKELFELYKKYYGYDY